MSRNTMDNSTYILPFTVANHDNFLMESHGIIRLEGMNFHIEYQSKDSFIGVVKTSVKELDVPLDQIQTIQFKKGLFTQSLYIQAKQMRIFGDVPGSKQAGIELKIKRSDRKSAEYLASAANLRLSELRLAAYDSKEELLP